jgi:DnaK suppressor protein
MVYSGCARADEGATCPPQAVRQLKGSGTPVAKKVAPKIASKTPSKAKAKSPATKAAMTKAAMTKAAMTKAAGTKSAGTVKAAAPKAKSPAAKAPIAKSTSKPAGKPAAKVAKPAKAVVVKSTPAKVVEKPKPAAKVPTAVVAATKPSLVKALVARPAKALKSIKRDRPKLDDKPVRLPPPRVHSNSKTAKNKAGLASKEVEHFRDLLLEKRRELLGDVSSMERDALQGGNTNLSTLPMHMADTGTDNYEQEFTLGLVEKDRQLLREIQSALAKIQDGSYGICEGTGKPISKPRLEAQPWAKFSIEHARSLERPQFRRAF